MTDLTRMSQAELDKLIMSAEKAKEQVTQKEDFVRRISEMAQAEGFDMASLFKQKVSAKYRNPERPEQTWTGRGRQPAWLGVKLAGGHALADFLVNS
jgi:DNA-binding protein H-NS